MHDEREVTSNDGTVGGVRCQLCGRGLYGLKGAYLARVNETGVPGIWECRPSCAADLPQETLLPMALETPPGVELSSTPESKSE